jgi:uncharacterized membrane protein
VDLFENLFKFRTEIRCKIKHKMMWKTLTLIGLLWSSSFGPQLLSVVEARKSGGGSGTGRGGGAARTGLNCPIYNWF